MKKLLTIATVLMLFLVGCQGTLLNQESSNETSKTDVAIQTNEITTNFPAIEYETAVNEELLTDVDTGNDTNIDEANRYYAYLQELETKENSFIEQAQDTQSLNAVAAEIFKLWDDELNIIYQKLKLELAPQEFELLQLEQKDWIIYKQNEVEKVRQDWQGASCII